MQLVTVRNKFTYPRLKRIDSDTGRTYSLEGGTPVPSVTTILSGTKNSAALSEWESRIGTGTARAIRDDAATVGTHMHSVLERMILNRPLGVPRTWLAVRGYRMGYALIETFFPDVQEVWGAEIPLLYRERYAGTSDCIGVYKNTETIIDFKQANTLKKREWIEDYFLQLAAYAEAHDSYHGTSINQGVIMMVAQDGKTAEFLTCGREFQGYRDKWRRRVDDFYKKEAGGVSTGQ